jgi:hypothetical protein
VIRTPTATVTDLGTEFGVEVSKEGETTSHVFRGSVRLQVTSSDGNAEGAAQILLENESARVERNEGKCAIVVDASTKPANFVRKLLQPTIKTFDLVDVVAGGDGFSGRRNAGIDLTNGRATTTWPTHQNDRGVVGDRQYHRALGTALIDGIFIPEGSTGPVQIDSAGHTFAFPPTDNSSSVHLWAGGPIPGAVDRPDMPVVRTELDGIDYSASGHGIVFLGTNKGDTFDLDAIRRTNPGHRLVRFRAVAGNTLMESPDGPMPTLADVWVLVDGEVRFRQREINGHNGGFAVAFAIGEKDRFLTLAATDGGSNHRGGWVLFGDPRLELLPSQQ